jgi:hypothetical protein
MAVAFLNSVISGLCGKRSAKMVAKTINGMPRQRAQKKHSILFLLFFEMLNMPLNSLLVRLTHLIRFSGQLCVKEEKTKVMHHNEVTHTLNEELKSEGFRA